MAPIPNPPESENPPPSAPARRSAAKAPSSKPAPAKPSGEGQANAVDPAKAAKLRASGLVQLNRGAVDKAVDLLQQALALDPGNALIQRDLERALRIRQAVRAKP
jgi:Tfp pilus assembly protein PilF